MNRNNTNQPAPEPKTHTLPVFDADQPTENAGAPLHQGRRSASTTPDGSKDHDEPPQIRRFGKSDVTALDGERRS